MLKKFAPILAGVAVLLLLIVVIARITASAYPEAATIGNNAPSFSVLAERFSDLARNKGGVYAFNVLKIAALPPNTDTHLLGHVVGDVLYSQKGIEGIADCTQDFRNACSHTIVVGALNEYGASSSTLALIDSACKDAPGGTGAYTMCYHGLGHGVLAYYAYDLKKTAAFCKRTGTPEYDHEQFAQCVGGAIMEILSGGGHDHEAWVSARERQLSKRDPLSPCDTAVIPQQAKGYCYLYLTPRLFEFAGSDIGAPDPAVFPKALSYCAVLPKETRERDACFGGFGKDFVGLAAARDIRAIDRLDSAAYTLAATWCASAPVADGVESCLRQALESVFWGGENDPNASFRFCAAAPQDLIDRCFTYLSGDIGHYLRGGSKEHWCSQLPKAYREGCSA